MVTVTERHGTTRKNTDENAFCLHVVDRVKRRQRKTGVIAAETDARPRIFDEVVPRIGRYEKRPNSVNPCPSVTVQFRVRPWLVPDP
jgi:hypothetical protein